MKILLYRWNAYSEVGLLKCLKEKGHTVVEFDKKIENHIENSEFCECLEKEIINENIEIVISFNYFPLISTVCERSAIRYISWIFSNPDYALYSNNIFYEGNYIFCFDKEQCLELKKYGVKHIYHLPLGVDSELFTQSISQENKEMISDVSFVGTLYTDERDYFKEISYLPEYIRGYIEGVCESQLNVIGYNIVKDAMTDHILSELKKYINFNMDNDFFLPFDKFIVDIINKKITIMERSRTLERFGRRFNVNLYTDSDSSHIPYINNKGYINYYSQMPEVFAKSKINLNITLRSITTGIPLRVLDIMASGGFVLTNNQQEIAEHFVDGEDLAIYNSVEEAIEKCEYYLTHEEERIKIILNGYEKVKREFSYSKQVDIIFSVINRRSYEI